MQIILTCRHGLATDGGHSNRSIGGKKPKPLLEENKDGMAYLEHSGYNPKRQEFDPEYDNDAELPLAEMEFKEIDTETDRELKLQMLHIYLLRLIFVETVYYLQIVNKFAKKIINCPNLFLSL